jgi:heat shock protein HslJ
VSKSRHEATVGSRPPVAGLVALAVVLVTCGQPDATAGPVTTQVTTTLPTTTQPPAEAPTTDANTSDTVSIEAEKFAEASGLTPEEAEEMLLAQAAGVDALVRLSALLGDDLVEGAFSPDMRRADEVTLYVVDEAAVEKTLNLLGEVGLDPDKTTVEVATPQPPESVWDWQDEEPYSAYEWLEYPGPMIGGPWHLVSTDGDPAPTDLTVGLGARVWGTDACTLGDYALATLTATLTISIDTSDCPSDLELLDPVLSAIRASQGRFQVSVDASHLIWTGSKGASLTWQRPDFEDEFGEIPTIADDSSSTYTSWAASLGPEVEGTWDLDRVGGETPAAPVTLDMNGSLWQINGTCNRISGVYGITTDEKLGLTGSSTQVLCMGREQTVEDQIENAFPDPMVLDVSFDDEIMIWAGSDGSLFWHRASQTPSG